MKIKRVELTNVKCYSSAEFNFENGINFISGINGAGKTSIIESIGFALFDYKAGRAGFNNYFIKRGEKKAVVRIKFEDKNKEEYIVERKLSVTSNNSWIIKDIENEEEIVAGEIDVINWLKDHLGFYRDDNISQIYENIISVPQGRFTSAFLDTAQNRKNTFDPIFNLEVYRTIYKNTLGLENGLKNKKIKFESDVRVKEARIEMLKENKNEYTNVKKEITKQKEIKREQQNKYDEINKLYEEKGKIKNELTNIEALIKLDKVKEENLSTNIEKLKYDLKISSEAKKVLEENKAEYEVYIQEEHRQRELKKKRKEYDTLNGKKKGLEIEVDTGNKMVELKEEAKGETIKINKSTLIDIKELEGKIQDEESKLSKMLIEIEQQRINVEEYKQKTLILEEQKKIIDENILRIQGEKKNIERLQSIVIKENELLEKKQEMEDYIKTNKLLEEAKSEIEGELSKLTAKLEYIKESKKIAKEGMCPYLKTQCINVKGKTQEEYEQELKDIKEELKQIKTKKVQIEKQEKEIVKAETELKNIISKLEEIKETKKEIEQLQKQVKLKYEQNEKEEKVIYKILEEVGIQKDNEKVLEFSYTIDEFKIISDKMQQELNERDTQYNVLKTKLENSKKEFEKRTKELEKGNKTMAKLEEEIKLQKLSIQKYEEQIIIIKQSLKEYVNIEDELEQNEKLLLKTRKSYDKYIQNKEIANKTVEIEKILEDNLIELKTIGESLENNKIELEKLKDNYNETEFKEIEKKKNDLQIELAEINTKISTKNERLKVLKEYVDELKKEQEIVKEININIEKYKKVIDYFVKIRQIIKQAPEDIAEILVEKVSKKATEIYTKIANDNTRLEWREGYEIILVDNIEENIIEKEFKQLSGGEQMSAALAIRISMLEILTNIQIGILDEPTVNMDTGRRQRLAEIIESIGGLFIQLFVVSHDDTFNSITENTIQL